MEENNSKELNLLDLIRMFFNWLKRLGWSFLRLLGNWLRMLCRNWAVTLVVLAASVAVALYLGRTENRKYKAEAMAILNGSISQMIFMIQHYNDVPIYNKDGSITIEQTSLVDAEGNVYTWNGTEVVDKTGTVVTDYVELRDAYDNVIVWNGTELVPKETNIKCDRQQLIEGISTIDSFKRLDGTTVTTYIDTVHRVFYESKGGGGGSTSLSGALQGGRSIAPASASVASAMPNTMSSISLLSEGQRAVTSATNRLRDAVAPLAASASDVAGRVSVVVEQNSVAGAARSIGSRLSRTPPYPGSGTRESQADRAVNITIDGIGTTARVQSIALNLLDELERVGAI